jgi:mono/diheme cytochrome c family protein
MSRHICRFACSAGLAGALLGVTVSAVAAQAPLRSVKDGVYSAAQATRGRALYEEKCTGCHAHKMWGQDWPEKSVFDVYDVVKNFMPEDNPGSLTAAQTRDVVAYILQNNQLPVGKTELPEAETDLKLYVAEASRTLHLARLRYDQGYSAYLEVLDAQRTLNVAQLALIRNRQAYLSYTVDLMNALGGGWKG